MPTECRLHVGDWYRVRRREGPVRLVRFLGDSKCRIHTMDGSARVVFRSDFIAEVTLDYLNQQIYDTKVKLSLVKRHLKRLEEIKRGFDDEYADCGTGTYTRTHPSTLPQDVVWSPGREIDDR